MTTTTIDIPAMRKAATEATAFLKSLANQDRLMLLCHLADGERSVSELESLTDIAQPSLSQQLGVLRSEGIVETRRDGKFMFYRIADARVMSLLNSLQETFCPGRRKPSRTSKN